MYPIGDPGGLGGRYMETVLFTQFFCKLKNVLTMFINFLKRMQLTKQYI